MAGPQKKSLDAPDQVVKMERVRIEIIEIAGGGVARATFEPGWKWSEHEKPVVGGGDYCEEPHFAYVAAGQIHVVFVDGSEIDLKAGDIATIPSGHDAWVVGDEPAVMLDFGAVAKPF